MALHRQTHRRSSYAASTCEKQRRFTVDVRRLPHLRRRSRALARPLRRFLRQRARSDAALAHARPHARSARRRHHAQPPHAGRISGRRHDRAPADARRQRPVRRQGAHRRSRITTSCSIRARPASSSTRRSSTISTWTRSARASARRSARSPKRPSVVPLMTIGGLHMRSVVVARRRDSVPPRRSHAHRRSARASTSSSTRSSTSISITASRTRSRPAFKPPADAVAIPIALDDRTPVVRARADAVTGRVVLDTGANRSVFGVPFAARAEVGVRPRTGHAIPRARRHRDGARPCTSNRSRSPRCRSPIRSVEVSSADLGAEDIDGTAGSDVLHAYDSGLRLSQRRPVRAPQQEGRAPARS